MEDKNPRNKKITPRIRNFISAYVLHGDAKKSAIMAGYKESSAVKQGYRLSNNPTIKALIEEGIKARDAEMKASVSARVARLKDKDYWLSEVLNTYQNYDDQSPSKLKALEVLGKSCGHLNERESLNLFAVDNRTLTHNEIVVQSLDIARKLQLIGQDIAEIVADDPAQASPPKNYEP